jgi:AraC family transcriptional regulator
MLAETIYAGSKIRLEAQFDRAVHLLVMYHDGARHDGETSIDGVPPSRLRNLTNKLTFVPAGHAYHEWHVTSMPMRMTYLYVAPGNFRKMTEGKTTFVPRILFEDPVVWETAAKLKAEIERGESGNTPYLEALANLLGCELVRSSQQQVRTPATNRGGLAGWQIRAVTGYVEEHLDEQIALGVLARVARLSQCHFCRAFKQSLGITPLQYLLQRRVQWAKALLSERANSTTEVGLTLGYAQSSSFTVAFRKVTGQTPSAFRRNFA